MSKPVRDIGASVRARLLNLAQQQSQQFQLLLTRYVLERFLYRLSLTPHRDRFVLKGAMLIATWFPAPHCPTRDIDLLGFGEPDPEAMQEIFREICSAKLDDGVIFEDAPLKIGSIREDLAYGGFRLKTTATLDGARINLVIDVAFGDAVIPAIADMKLPVLLDQPAPYLRAYPREAVIAEKFQAMIEHGHANTRLKDYYDIWILAKTYAFDGSDLAQAIAATFHRRQTAIPAELPEGLSPTFADLPKRRQWAAFVKDVTVQPGSLREMIDELAAFLMPRAREARMIDLPVGENSPGL